MRFSPLLKRGVAILASFSAIALSIPAASLEAACSNTSDSNVRYGATIQQCDNANLQTIGKSETVIVTIDDKGFHPSEVTVGNSPIDPHVYFVNLGNNTHTATQVPSSPMFNSGAFVTIGQDDFVQVDAKGKGRGNQIFDTGGITPDPGASVQQAINDRAYKIASFKANGDYLYTSYTDCLAADRVVPSPTGFDCTPAIIHVVDEQLSTSSVQKVLGPGATYLGTSLRGTVLRPLGDKDCAMIAAGNPMMAPDRTNACVSARRFNDYQKQPTGSKTKPLMGSVTINIDDINGFDPCCNVNVAVDVPVTFTNNANNQLVHSVVLSNTNLVSNLANGADTVTNTNSGGLAPGQSWTVGFHYVARSTIEFVSNTSSDLIQNVNPQGNVGPSVAFNGAFFVVCPPGQFSTVSFDGFRGVGRPCTSIAAAQDPAVLVPGTVKDF